MADKQKFDMSGYVDVAERLTELREKHPEASVQPADPSVPYRIEDVGGQTFIVVVAACYRTADDPRPGVGMAWEPFPGKTPYTKDSELQNAETSAWGRAIVAALAADTRRGVSSAQEVRNRQAEPAELPYRPAAKEAIEALQERVGALEPEILEQFKPWKDDQAFPWPWPAEAVEAMNRELDRLEAPSLAPLAGPTGDGVETCRGCGQKFTKTGQHARDEERPEYATICKPF